MSDKILFLWNDGVLGISEEILLCNEAISEDLFWNGDVMATSEDLFRNEEDVVTSKDLFWLNEDKLVVSEDLFRLNEDVDTSDGLFWLNEDMAKSGVLLDVAISAFFARLEGEIKSALRFLSEVELEICFLSEGSILPEEGASIAYFFALSFLWICLFDQWWITLNLQMTRASMESSEKAQILELQQVHHDLLPWGGGGEGEAGVGLMMETP